MEGFKAYRVYMAMKLHFQSASYDVFTTNANVKCSRDTFEQRRDRMIFEGLGRKFTDDREYIRFLASNFMYGSGNIYEAAESLDHYQTFKRRRQAITSIFRSDLDTILQSNSKYEFEGTGIPDVMQLFMGNRITIETMVILDTQDDIVKQMLTSNHLRMIMGGPLTTISKARRFVMYRQDRIEPIYDDFKQQLGVTTAQ